MRIKVWDLPVRLCHWLLALSVLGAFVSVNMGEMEWHMRFGYAAATLAVFRVIWGIIGSDTARFSRFVRGPGAILAYLQGRWAGFGHNPIGALSVIALLLAVLAQAGTGIFANDDIIFDAPWALVAGKETSDAMTGWHKTIRLVLLALIALHIAAIIFYRVVKRERLLLPMITGRKEVAEVPPPGAAPRMRGVLLAIPALALSVFLTGLAFRFWLT